MESYAIICFFPDAREVIGKRSGSWWCQREEAICMPCVCMKGVIGVIFDLPPILGLTPLIVYIILAFRPEIHPLINVIICLVIGAVLTETNLLEFGSILTASLGSFLGQVGFIIMIGSGLGLILKESGVAENLVYLMVRKIGINSMNKAILASMLTSMFMVLVLSTLTGGNAVIAPIIIPLVASVGMTPSTLAVIMQSAGVTGLFISPFSPPMVTIMELTGMAYQEVLLYASLPVCIPIWLITYFNAKRVQKATAGVSDYPEGTALSVDAYDAAPEAKRATRWFSVAMILVVAYGVIFNLGVAHAITVITVAVIATGFGARFKVSKTIDLFMQGCAQYFWIFMLFILMDPFLNFISKSGAFDALVEIGEPLVASGGKVGLAMLASLIGTFGIQGAAVAQAVMMDTVFRPLVEATGLSMSVWALVILIGSQMTSFAYPGLDMVAATGTARSSDMKSQVKHGWLIVAAVLIVCLIMSLIFG